MKTRLILLLIVLISFVSAFWIILRPTVVTKVTVHLSSDPFPLAVGQTTLRVALEGVDAAQVDQMRMRVSSHIDDGGSLTVDGMVRQNDDGTFDVALIYPRIGRWRIDVTVYLPGQSQPIQEQYPVYVYQVSSWISTGFQQPYRSLNDLDALTQANPSKEYWIVIPQGAYELAMHGTGEELVPDEIRLQVSGRNRLIIQNNDVEDHNIGPFFVRAGETIRQEFTQPATYQGTCSIRHTDEITITVEA